MIISFLGDAPSLPKPPTLHGFIETMVAKIFGSASILAIFVIVVFWVKSWIDWAKRTVKTTRKVGVLSQDAARIAFERLREMRSMSVAFAVAVTVAILSLQVLWLYGAYASASFADEAWREMFMHGVDTRQFVFHWDAFTGSYVLLFLLIMASAYVMVARWPNEASTWVGLRVMFAVVVSVPTLVLLLLGLVLVLGLILGTIVVWLSDRHVYMWQIPAFLPILGLTVLMIVEVTGGVVAVGGPRLTRWAWQQPDGLGDFGVGL